jgi:TatA/E family protein of Tat protein translocase
MVAALAFIDSPEQILLILAIALLFFGPTKLPQLGSAFGKTIRAYREGMQEAEAPGPAPVLKERVCARCGKPSGDRDATFCTQCGGSLT